MDFRNATDTIFIAHSITRRYRLLAVIFGPMRRCCFEVLCGHAALPTPHGMGQVKLVPTIKLRHCVSETTIWFLQTDLYICAASLLLQALTSPTSFQVTDPNTQLSPGDLISVEPTAIPMLSSKLADAAAKAAAKLEAEVAEKKAQAAAERAQEQGESGEADSDAAPPAETQAAEPVKAEGEASAESVEASSEKAAEVQETSESSEKDATVSAQSAEATPASSDATSSTKEKTKGAASAEQREEGVLPFTLPHYAAPFLFIPPYLEPSFTTCSAIYLRHPTIVPHRVSSSSSERSESGNYSNNSNSSRLPTYRTDIPSPYPAGGEMFTMAWEHYARDAPRVRGELRREKMEAQGGRKGFSSARAKDVHTQRNAIRRGWGRRMET